MKKIIFFTFVFIIYHLTFNIYNCSAQWQTDVRLTNDPDSSLTCLNYARCIASNGNVAHVVWYDTRDGNREIYYKRSTDGGVSWGADVRLTNDTAASYNPSIAVSGTLVHVTWYDKRIDNQNDIYYKRSTDSGINWGPDIRLTSDPASSVHPSIAASGNFVCIAFTDNRNSAKFEIYYMHSTNGGENWTTETQLTNALVWAIGPSISISGSNVHLVWMDQRDGNYEIYYKRSTDGGITWDVDTRLTNDPATSTWTSVAVSDSNVHVVWHDIRDGNFEIYYKHSTDDGLNWGADTRLTNDPSSSSYPSVTVSGSYVHVVWQDIRAVYHEIFYKRSTDAGFTWSADTSLTNAPGYSGYPSIALSGTFLHVLWTDDRDGNLEIYYKNNPSGNPIGIVQINTEIPKEFKLEQNYPNPFNPSTTIKFDIAKTGFVTLKIYNILGKEIKSLVNEKLDAGSYYLSWDAAQYPSGVYFYRIAILRQESFGHSDKIKTEGFSDVKRMILIK